MKNLGLYLHMPFCRQKCAYCDFYSVTDEKKMSEYVSALRLQMEDYSEACESYDVDTVFLGGGTPSVLPKKLMGDIFKSVYENFNVTDDAEFTMEINPATVDKSMLKFYKNNGVNRLSIGMQSTVDSELSALGRIHDYEDFLECYYDARKAKFENINIDIMYGIPGQTVETLKETISKVIELAPEHISLYGLMVEEGTPLYSKVKNNEVTLPDEDEEYEMYCTAIDMLGEAGYVQYEISNFSLPGYECRHNLKYWNCEEYLGLGPAAHSYFGTYRFSFKKDIALYIKALESTEGGSEIIDENYQIKPNERLTEYVMLQLRLCSGLDTEEFYRNFGKSFESLYGKYLTLYVKNGFMKFDGKRYSFTTKGMYVSNYILSTMLDFDSEITENIAKGTDK